MFNAFFIASVRPVCCTFAPSPIAIESVAVAFDLVPMAIESVAVAFASLAIATLRKPSDLVTSPNAMDDRPLAIAEYIVLEEPPIAIDCAPFA